MNEKKLTLNIVEHQRHQRPSPCPSHSSKEQQFLDDEEKIDYIAEKFRDIMEALGLDLDDPSLSKTPYRIAKMYVQEVFSGLDTKTFPNITFMENEEKNPHLVFVTVRFTSFCEHHFVPFYGTAYVGYLPNQKLVGLSKIPRLVKYFSRRPQVQERLTVQIADSLAALLETEDVGVSITAQHMCVMARGIEDHSSMTTTNVFRGKFENEMLRREFFEAIQRKSV